MIKISAPQGALGPPGPHGDLSQEPSLSLPSHSFCCVYIPATTQVLSYIFCIPLDACADVAALRTQRKLEKRPLLKQAEQGEKF